MIKIGVRNNYCCQKDCFLIYYIPLNCITNKMKFILRKYTNSQNDITKNDNISKILTNYVKSEDDVNVNMYEQCEYKLYVQIC